MWNQINENTHMFVLYFWFLRGLAQIEVVAVPVGQAGEKHMRQTSQKPKYKTKHMFRFVFEIWNQITPETHMFMCVFGYQGSQTLILPEL